MTDPLTPRDVHVWYCYCDDLQVTSCQRAYLSLLTPEETARYESFAFEKDRRLFLVARALLRTTLSRYAAVSPAAWRFEQTPKGKLLLAPLDGLPALTFNVSHSGQLAVCAVTLDKDIGVDVESTVRPADPKVATHFLAPQELSHFHQAGEEVQRELFYRYWTLKESYAKALGMGLSLRFTEFAFLLNTQTNPTIAVDPQTNDVDLDWQFHQRFIPPHYCLAVAVRCPADPRLLFSIRCEPPAMEIP